MIRKLQTPPKIWLNLNICKAIYNNFKQKIEFSEPLPHFEDRYVGRLESILGTVEGSFGNFIYYPTILDAAAAYLVKLNCRHPFTNGNKRISVLFTDTFLFLNDLDLTIPYNDMFILSALIAKDHEDGISENKQLELCKNIIADFTKTLPNKE